MILPPIGKLYGLAMKVRNGLYDRGIFRTHSLGARTISIGNLTTGGTGKTPLVALISEMLVEGGETVCILTRGYGRRNAGERVLVSDGSTVLADAATGGDEPVELAIRLGGKAVIIADADRFAAGRWAKEKFGVTAFVLDDGFQHRRVKRDLDVVCIDATDPCGGGRVLPAGRLRESFDGLKRADAIVITRTELVDDVSAIEDRLRGTNDSARIFRASTRIARLVALEEFHATAHMMQSVVSGGGRMRELVNAKFGAFCAVGNPGAFFRTLEANSGDNNGLVFTKAFSDHHSYTQADLEEIGQLAKERGAEILVTTAKDAVKLWPLSFELPCLVVEAETMVDNAEGLRRLMDGG